MNPKLAFASQAVYPNYCTRVKEHILKSYFDNNLQDYNIPYYITTNQPNLLEEYSNHKLIKILDIDRVRNKHEFSIANEKLPEDPTGLYPGKYPWNLHRYSIEQAALDEYNYIIYLDVDNKINQINTNIYDQIISLFEENTVATNLSLYHFKNRAPAETFQYHEKYISHFGFDFPEESISAPDGPIQAFMGKSHQDILNLIDKWHLLTEYGYSIPEGYRNSYLSNLSFAIPWSGFTVKHKNFPFTPHHVAEDRY